jgi:SdrD B-like domain
MAAPLAPTSSLISSGSITLTGGGEPTSDGDGNADSNLTIDFGLFLPASLGSLVWNDTDLDGIFDPTEQGVPGVTVTLYDASGAVIAITITSPTGSYEFGNLVPGIYVVGISDLPPDTTFTSPNQGGDDGNDSDVDPSTGLTSPITLVPGQNNLSIWAGIMPVQPTAISLRSFSASWDGSAMLLRWSTTMELNTFGFRLLRSASGQLGDAIIVTPVLILGEGRGSGGADYSWRDKSAQPGVTYTYWLQEVEIDGTTNLYGPASNGPQPSAGGYRVALPMVIR